MKHASSQQTHEAVKPRRLAPSVELGKDITRPPLLNFMQSKAGVYVICPSVIILTASANCAALRIISAAALAPVDMHNDSFVFDVNAL